MIYMSGSDKKISEIGKLNEMLAFCETLSCKRNYLMRYFGNDIVVCNNCESCLNTSEKMDASDIAKDVIQLIKSTKEKFAMTYLVLLLKGSNSKDVWDVHKELSLFGKYKDLNDLIIKKTIRQLIVSEVLRLDLDSGFNNLRVIKDCSEKIFIRKERAKIEIEKNIDEIQDTGDLMTQLKSLRTMIASRNGIPAYLVLHDKSLREMVKKKPKTIDKLKKIHGWGEVKIQKYGDEFLKVLLKNY